MAETCETRWEPAMLSFGNNDGTTTKMTMPSQTSMFEDGYTLLTKVK